MDGWMETILFFDFGYRGDSFSQIFENYPNKTKNSKILVGDRSNMSIYRYLRLEVP
jgi:predicted phosphoadenosine phosphosulfate sulfurtransferase